MKVTIVSRDTIKPSLSQSDLQTLKPHNLCVFDQLTPTTYPATVLFYSITKPDFNLSQTLTRMKNSLSETLTLFYPFSGRVKHNLYVDDFSAGAPFVEARVNRRMSDYFAELNREVAHVESLSELLPCKPFRRETDTSGPQIAIQVTVFECNGFSVGASVSHKLSDAKSLGHFLDTWAVITSGAKHKIVPPNLSDAAKLFPSLQKMPENAVSLMDRLWFERSNKCATRRFFFDEKAIDALKALARSEGVPVPTRNEVVSCFIWKHAMSASRAVSAKPRTSVVTHAVNIRRRMKPQHAAALERCTGNLFWWAGVAANPAEEDALNSEGETGLAKLVALTREVLNTFDGEYLETMVGEDGFEPLSEFLSQLEAMLSEEAEKPDIFAFTNWKGFFNGIDFGFGKPAWVGSHGGVGAEFRNLIVLADKQGSEKEIEAFLNLEEKIMGVLEKDKKFMAFASPTNLVKVFSGVITSRI